MLEKVVAQSPTLLNKTQLPSLGARPLGVKNRLLLLICFICQRFCNAFLDSGIPGSLSSWIPAEGRGPHVVSITLQCSGMVLDCPWLAMEAQLVRKSGK